MSQQQGKVGKVFNGMGQKNQNVVYSGNEESIPVPERASEVKIKVQKIQRIATIGRWFVKDYFDDDFEESVVANERKESKSPGSGK